MKLRIICIVLFFIAVCSGQAAAHPGGLDENRGHTCISNCSQWGFTDGEYHYHRASSTKPTSAPIYYEPFSQFNSPTFDYPVVLAGLGLVGALTYGVYKKQTKPQKKYKSRVK